MFRLNLLKVIPNNQLCEWTLVWVALVQSLQLMLVKHRPDPVTTSLQHQIFPLALISCFYHINSEAHCIPGATPTTAPVCYPSPIRGHAAVPGQYVCCIKMLSELWERSWAVCKAAATFFVILIPQRGGTGMAVMCQTVLAGVSVDVQRHAQTPETAPAGQYRNACLKSGRAVFTVCKVAIHMKQGDSKRLLHHSAVVSFLCCILKTI